MPHYAWVCHSCKTVNPANSDACSVCACPAVASAADITEAKTGVKRPLQLSRKEWQALRRTEIAALPFWKKPIAYALQAMRLVGSLFIVGGIFSLSLSAGLLGFGVILIAEVMFSLLKGPPYVWEES